MPCAPERSRCMTTALVAVERTVVEEHRPAAHSPAAAAERTSAAVADTWAAVVRFSSVLRDRPLP